MEIRRNINKRTASSDIKVGTRVTTDKFSRRPPHKPPKKERGSNNE